MTTAHEERFEELLPAYALGALEGVERLELERHLESGCAICERELAGAYDAFERLAESVEPVEPSATTRARLFREIASTASSTVPSSSIVEPASKVRKWIAAAAVAAALAVVAGSVVFQQRGELDQLRTLASNGVELEARIDRLSRQNADLENQVTSLESERAVLQTDLAERLKVAGTLSAELNRVQAEARDQGSRLAAVREERDGLARDLALASQERNGLADRLQLLQARYDDLNGELKVMAASQAGTGEELARLRIAYSIITAPDAFPVELGGAGIAPDARARAFVDPTSGRGVLLADTLAPQGAQFDYELWTLPADGAPRPAGVFDVDDAGMALHVFDLDLEQTATLAVTIEAAGGVDVPNLEKLVLLGQLAAIA